MPEYTPDPTADAPTTNPNKALGLASYTMPMDSSLNSLAPQGGAIAPQDEIPSPERTPATPSAKDLVEQYLLESKGDENAALLKATNARTGKEHDPNLRDAEHMLFSRLLMGIMGPAGPALSPFYSAAKKYAQSGLPGAGMLNSVSTKAGLPLAGPTTSAPSMGEVKAGLSPLANPRSWMQNPAPIGGGLLPILRLLGITQ
jgi:hypothetical protein